jgi:small-conductance mechanosensitive channel
MMNDILQTELAANSIQNWLVALAIVVATLFVAGIVRYLGIKEFHRLATSHEVTLWIVMRKVVRRTRWLFILILALFTGSLVLKLPQASRDIINSVMIITVLVQAGLWASSALQVFIEQYQQDKVNHDPATITTLNVLNFIGRIVLWAIVLLLILDNLGVNITALVAGLGIGGIAVALAVQNVLGDLLASLSIVLDKPFVIGDFIIVDELLGSVEYVGLKTTRLRSLSGEQLVFSNADLLNSRIRNYGRMYERRVAFDLGVTYQTPRDKLRMIPGIIREAVEKQDNARFDRSNFKQFGNFSLNVESVYFIKGPDYNEYMNIQEAILLHIHERFEQEGIEFAYPTQTVFMQQNA